MNKTIIFRTDGNNKIATGHVMRCLSYAHFFKRNGCKCIFVAADAEMENIITENGFEFVSLCSVYCDLEQELPSIKDLIFRYQPNLMVIDSYFVTPLYLKEVTQLCKTLYIDDLNSFDYPVTYLLNYSIYAEDLPYNKQNKQLLLGTEYSCLRQQFYNCEKIAVNQNIKNVFITTGGADCFSICKMLVENKLRQPKLKNVVYHIILGKFFNQEEVAFLQEACVSDVTIRLYQDVRNMAEIMAQCDVAISAGGSTLYELSFLGVPTIALITADNQIYNVQGFVQRELMLFGGNQPENYQQCIEEAFESLDFETRKCLNEKLRQLYNTDKKESLLKVL